MGRYEMRFTGSGGQGVILASVIFAEAAVLAGKNAVQSQAYGPEARGGSSKAETIVSTEPIWYSKVERPDFLLALNQASLDKYLPDVKDGGTVLADASLAVPRDGRVKFVSLAMLQTAVEKVGRAVTGNIVSVGAINALLGLFPGEILREAVKMHIPAGTEELNMKALGEGEKLAREYSLSHECCRVNIG